MFFGKLQIFPLLWLVSDLFSCRICRNGYCSVSEIRCAGISLFQFRLLRIYIVSPVPDTIYILWMIDRERYGSANFYRPYILHCHLVIFFVHFLYVLLVIIWWLIKLAIHLRPVLIVAKIPGFSRTAIFMTCYLCLFGKDTDYILYKKLFTDYFL